MSKGRQDSEEKEEEVIKIGTIPFDPRFPQQNQTLNCFIHYTDYFRCMDALKGDGACEHFKRVFTTLCPTAWVAKWDEQRSLGTFPGRLIRVPADYCSQQKPTDDDNE